jgi:hypothetical protein
MRTRGVEAQQMLYSSTYEIWSAAVHHAPLSLATYWGIEVNCCFIYPGIIGIIN